MPRIRRYVAKHCIALCCFVDNSQDFKQLIEIVEAEGKKIKCPVSYLPISAGVFCSSLCSLLKCYLKKWAPLLGKQKVRKTADIVK